MEISKLDHLVLTVTDIEKTASFYVSVMGMKKEVFGGGRVALKYGSQKINLHELGREIEPKANKPMAHVRRCGVEIIEGPVERKGANGPLRSFYFRDPDNNLIEVANEI
jgi:catechol 2,3-dioxygenase-like lactoylglutathione lyase family enzyme